MPDRGGHLWPKDRTASAPDGTIVRYTVLGRPGTPWLVTCAGFLCPDNFWVHLGPDLARDHQVLVLNYRGIGASSEARGEETPTSPHDYSTLHLASDVAAVLDAEGATAATVLGHSMGVQVALALWQQRPELVAGLALVAGPFASPFGSMYGTSIGNIVFPLVSMGVPMLPLPASRALMHALELPVAMPVARLIRAMGPHTPTSGMSLYREHMGNVDPRTAIWTARGMHAFDAEPWLRFIDVPTIVVVGTADTWTPEDVGRELADEIPDAELLVVPGGSHTLPIEFPDQVIRAVRSLFDRPLHGAKPDGAHAASTRQ